MRARADRGARGRARRGRRARTRIASARGSSDCTRPAQRRADAILTGDPYQPGALAKNGEILAWPGRSWRSAPAGREESKSEALLVRVPEPAPLRVAPLMQIAIELIHGGQASDDVSETTGNLT